MQQLFFIFMINRLENGPVIRTVNSNKVDKSLFHQLLT
ncbi:hypothetical protein AB01_4156 [Escherichia coli 2-177-06_S1_C1]|nr:hypothetical protein ECDEC6B_4571 [Escherichia coli DEC6B]EIN50873.1 hypothetical protein ECPA3_4868 [Escherichia coli PA3]EKH22237.1 hypothetical protein ECFDA504_4754 [Escherichia coli FDA504]EKK24425.1 hypothetical protein EC60172_4928 [Escherichia coli 6.0172]KDW15647.1 hypothetical protein AB01_4156 [Escherichia coli 2-177-06_S1_C1]